MMVPAWYRAWRSNLATFYYEQSYCYHGFLEKVRTKRVSPSENGAIEAKYFYEETKMTIAKPIYQSKYNI